jgi:hypothetical protein
MSGTLTPDDAIKNEKQAKGQAFVDDLMSRIIDVDGIPKMTVLNKLTLLSGRKADVVVRACTVPFWKACIDLVDEDTDDWSNYRCCAVGNPGIGKTTSTVVLIHMLLQKEKTVLYRIRGMGSIYEFQRKKVASAAAAAAAAATVETAATATEAATMAEETAAILAEETATTAETATTGETERPEYSYICTIHDESSFPTGIASANDETVYYIVDPNKTKDSCDPKDDFKPKVIIVSSPNDLHWGGSEFDKERDDEVAVSGGLFCYYPLWTLEELLDGREGLNNYARTDLDEEEVKKRYQQVGGVPRHVFCTARRYEAVCTAQSTALARLTSDQARLLAMRQETPIGSLDSGQPKSAIIGFVQKEGDTSFCRVKYSLVSWAIQKQVFEIHLSNVWASIFNAPNHGPVFEGYTWMLLAGGQEKSFRTREAVGAKKRKTTPHLEVRLGGCSGVKPVWDIVVAAMDEPGVMFLPNSDQYEFIDFAYAKVDENELRVHAFQSTVSRSHKAKAKGIENIEQSLPDGIKATVYFLVPENKYDGFTTNPAEPKSEKIDFKIVRIPHPPTAGFLGPQSSLPSGSILPLIQMQAAATSTAATATSTTATATSTTATAATAAAGIQSTTAQADNSLGNQTSSLRRRRTKK